MSNLNWFFLFFLILINLIIFSKAVDYVINLIVSKFNQTDEKGLKQVLKNS